MTSSPDYKKLYLEAEEQRKHAEQRRIQEEERWKHAEERRKHAEERLIQEEEKWKQAVERREKAEHVLKQESERNRRTTFMEFLCHSHNLFSRPLKVKTPYHSTTVTIPPKRTSCPLRLRPWNDCAPQQQAVYDRVCHYLQPNKEPPHLFTPLATFEWFTQCNIGPMHSERCLESYEQIAVEHHVRDVIEELCKIPAAREEFMLGDGVRFGNHENALNETRDELAEIDMSNPPRPKLDQFCAHRVDGKTNSLLFAVQYKPPHKLSVENLRAGLRPMELWDELVNRDTVPSDPMEILQYNAELSSASALVQTYDIMIEEGRAHAILTNGLARVLLYVSHDDPATLNYHLCEPNREIVGHLQSFQQPMTSFARELCLCLMSFRSPTRNQEWRNLARSQAQVWETSFDQTRSSIPKEELQKAPQFDNVNSRPSKHHPSSALESSMADCQVSTRPRTSFTTTDSQKRTPPQDSSGSGLAEVGECKRRITPSSSFTQQAAHECGNGDKQDNQSRYHDAQFCTQRY
ncbi:uncharacterized protein N7506_009987 [Penicillium brevicompactum]|uniref:uncharacterized protein n=1 Tax=Penicillium brevicompactum TaxID=5074 RepID=UPI002540C853|nr:uncharacterized protein N7506_009987 [Penicillium brevicompactum]KAJ5326885.1 hypothetical protein N7506_009987 [Penicillium brevicompactum]